METIIDILNHDVLLLIFDFLKDYDKVSFTMVNRYMKQYIMYIIYTDLHEYERIRHLPFKKNFRRLSFRPSYDIIIPSIITDLIIDEDFIGSLENIIPPSVKKLTIEHNIYVKNKSFIPSNISLHLTYYNQNFFGFTRIRSMPEPPKCGIIKKFVFH
ncbi:F-box and FNIP repeat-containing protein [Cotonvirus japonicus]|uniref:F-box and FNIP repeat-containing protein n=1 Tax=Cotonvirus japonicus TaxID=2811091 RepID=A0ABM7NRN8_9VIRU|nr:F-box and FNIP repeat-containing protein [Cotonvirus japonicus]BCS82824.1 F-box and FNIP repeat-containing protein [Cotonvirus japonicus]